jgi:hypothetical protein
MSYEGYTNVLCEAGHLHTFDAWDYSSPVATGEAVSMRAWSCPQNGCGKRIAWHCDVDETNGVGVETGRCPGAVRLEVDRPALGCTCLVCGYAHFVGTTTYKIPETEGHRVDKETGEPT